MLDTLAFRGPDDEGTVFLCDGRVALGHRRLTIIDLTSAGRQPMSNEDGSVWCVVNGEIYNHRSLRSELEKSGHRFRSRSDSEVVVHAFEEWGNRCVPNLRGIFALAIWDSRTGRLVLGRDHLGVKPLYYCGTSERFLFASQPRAFLVDRHFVAQADAAAMSEYLAYGYVPGDRSIFSGVRKLAAGCLLEVADGAMRLERYWKPEYTGEYSDFDVATAAVREKLKEAVELQLTSDVPVGAFLSGGIDSSSIVSLAKRSNDGLKTFTIGFDEASKDESSAASDFARRCGTDHHEQILRSDDARQLILDFVEIYDEPFSDSSGLPTYLVSRLAKSHGIKVALAGDGGDEVFAGYSCYDTYWAMRHPLHPRGARVLAEMLLRGTRPRDRINPFADSVTKFFNLRGFLGRREQELCLVERDAIDTGFADARALRKSFRGDCPAVTAAQLMDLDNYLDEILTKVDRASMAAGVEVRVPFLDPELVSLAFRINARCIYRQRERKAVLRGAMRNELPEELFRRRKQGFSIPLIDWMNERTLVSPETLLDDGVLVTRRILDPMGVRALLARRETHWTWLLCAAELWARRWLEGHDRHTLEESLAPR